MKLQMRWGHKLTEEGRQKGSKLTPSGSFSSRRSIRRIFSSSLAHLHPLFPFFALGDGGGVGAVSRSSRSLSSSRRNGLKLHVGKSLCYEAMYKEGFENVFTSGLLCLSRDSIPQRASWVHWSGITGIMVCLRIGALLRSGAHGWGNMVCLLRIDAFLRSEAVGARRAWVGKYSLFT